MSGIGILEGFSNQQKRSRIEDLEEQERLKKEERANKLDKRQEEKDLVAKEQRERSRKRQEEQDLLAKEERSDRKQRLLKYDKRDEEDRAYALENRQTEKKDKQYNRTRQKRLDDLAINQRQTKKTRDDEAYARKNKEYEALSARADEEGARDFIAALDNGNTIESAVNTYNLKGSAKILPETVKFDPQTGQISFKESDGDVFEGTIDDMRNTLAYQRPAAPKELKPTETLGQSKHIEDTAWQLFGGKPDPLDPSGGADPKAVSEVSAIASELIRKEPKLSTNEALFKVKQAYEQASQDPNSTARDLVFGKEESPGNKIVNRVQGFNATPQAAIDALAKGVGTPEQFKAQFGWLPEQYETSKEASAKKVYGIESGASK